MAPKNPAGKPQPLEQMARLPRPMRFLVLLALFCAVICLYYFGLYPGVREELEDLDSQLAQIELDIQKSRAAESNLQSFQAQQEELEAELELALQRLPNQKELPVLLTDISSLGKKSGLEIRSFKPAPEIAHGFYAEVPINVEFAGRFHEVAIFFDRLSRLSRIVNITELSMAPKDPKADPPRLVVKGVATTFRFLDDVPVSDGGA